MKTLLMLVRRNTKLFFKDKSVFFTSLIAPLILLFLFVTFLGGVYTDSFHSGIPDGLGIEVPDRLVNGFVGGWLFSSLLAVCCVTISFSANMIMVQDKATGRINDLTIAPVGRATLAVGYYVSTALVTLLICLLALACGLVYLAVVGWYLTAADVFLTILDVVLLVMFGTALSSIVCFFLRSQGGITAVTTIVSAAYGFLCGAYMPVSSFTPAIRNFIMFLPGTYGTSLLHSHLMGGSLAAMETLGFPPEVVKGIGESFDNTMFFFGNRVELWQAYLVVVGAVLVLGGLYILFNAHKIKFKRIAIKV